MAFKPVQVADDLNAICKILGEKTPTDVSLSSAAEFPSIAPLEMEY